MTHVIEASTVGRRLSTPRAAALAGILFALLMGSAQVLIRVSLPADSTDADLLEENARPIRFALNLIPFAGVAFLWFIGVMRDRIGEHEDRFFATIFLGSGILYLAMIFASAAVAGGIIQAYERDPTIVDSDVYPFSRATVYQIANIYALRMSGVFMMSLGTIWLRTGTMPIWFAVVTYAGALALLLAADFSGWIVLAFPVWVLLVSVWILVVNFRRQQEANLETT